MQQFHRLRVGRLRLARQIGVDVGRLLIGHECRGVRRHNRPRRAKLRHESRIGKRRRQARSFAAAGDLISYGPDTIEPYRLTAGYVDRILRGEKPADLPVQAASKYQLVVNLKTAKALGLEIPPTLLARADEVIE